MAALFSFSCLLLILLATGVYATAAVDNVPNTEETIADNLRLTFKQNKLASKQLVKFYLEKLYRQNPKLEGVIEAQENALNLADQADREREYKERVLSFSRLHGINPALVKLYSDHLSEDTTLASDEFKVALKAYLKELVTTPRLEKIEVLKKAAGLRLAAENAASEKLARKIGGC
ncbi:hypothetical protein TIFTF001_039326 [Ficus carica]|uniref:Uncharacterized protein n=1 Tax=Ficus carica TaxID=3494 RepID=A0AA88JFR1_FICCA|nr:hypothetical protein TIFTF001_039326 [Ficus carica]